MPTLYLSEDRALVRREGEDALLIQIPEKRGEGGKVIAPARKERVPLIKIEQVIVLGEVTLTSSALHLLLDNNIEINFLGYYGQFKGQLSPALSKNGLLRLAQHRAHNDPVKRAELARRFVTGKLANQRTILQRYNRRQSDPVFAEEIALLSRLLQALTSLPLSAEAVPPLHSGDARSQGTSIETILGLEGAGSAAYFRCFGKLFTDQAQWPFGGRIKRPPTDPINALLSYGYSILTSQVASAVQMTGFDHHIGYLHSSVYGRPALALDLMEEFRPIIVDSVVLSILNNRMLTPADFTVELGAYRLKSIPRKTFLIKLEERFNEEIVHPVFGYKVKYRRCIELQARLVAKFLTGEISAYPPFMVR